MTLFGEMINEYSKKSYILSHVCHTKPHIYITLAYHLIWQWYIQSTIKETNSLIDVTYTHHLAHHMVSVASILNCLTWCNKFVFSFNISLVGRKYFNPKNKGRREEHIINSFWYVLDFADFTSNINKYFKVK